MHQDEHERWNAAHYPGTRQLCSKCDEPTGRCEEDSIYRNGEGPLCEECAKSYNAAMSDCAGGKHRLQDEDGQYVHMVEASNDPSSATGLGGKEK